MKTLISYLTEAKSPERKPGETWRTAGGKFRGKNQTGHMQSFKDPEKAKIYVATKGPGGGEEEPKVDKPKDDEPQTDTKSKTTSDKVNPKKLDPEALKSKLIDPDVSKIMNYKERITDLKTRAEIENENKEDAEEVKALKHIGDSIEELDGDFKKGFKLQSIL